MKKITPKNVRRILSKLADFIEENDDRIFCDDIGYFLDEQLDNDMFGTEGQCDPRGDKRNT